VSKIVAGLVGAETLALRLHIRQFCAMVIQHITHFVVSLGDYNYQERSFSLDFDGLTFYNCSDIFEDSRSAGSTLPAK
jgi:hypothetical protein